MRITPTATFLKSLPLGLGLPIVIGAASIGPDDAVSNLSKWMNWAGFNHLPGWLLQRSADKDVIIWSILLSFFYIFAVWVLPEIRMRRHTDSATTNDDAPPIGSVVYVNAILEARLSADRKSFDGEIRIELRNTTDKPIAFHAITAGRINDIVFQTEKVEFDGFIFPNVPAYLRSKCLHAVPIRSSLKDHALLIYGVYEYELSYKFAETGQFGRATMRGIRLDLWGPIEDKEPGTIHTMETVVAVYQQDER